MIMGDLNSRLGIPTNLSIRKEICECEGVEDRTVNKNAKCVLDLCEDNKLVVVKNLKHGTHHFKSNLSFWKKTTWISEPDTFIVSESCIQHIASFDMVQRFNGKLLFSDHALVDVAMNLGNMKLPADLLRASKHHHHPRGEMQNVGRGC